MNKILSLPCRLYPILLQLLLLLGAGFAGRALADVADTLATVKPGVVGVGTFQPLRSPRANLTGTGFVVGDGRHVVSCAHIFKGVLDSENNESWTVLIGRDRQMQARKAIIVARDDERDLVLLKFGGDPLPALKLAATDSVREGWQLYFTGYPIGSILGLNPSTHRAGLAAVVPIFTPARNAAQLNVRTLRQALHAAYEVYELDAIAYPGNSGSPVWHPDSGDVLGVVNSVFVKGSKDAALSTPSGLTYAIPVRYVRDLLKSAGITHDAP